MNRIPDEPKLLHNRVYTSPLVSYFTSQLLVIKHPDVMRHPEPLRRAIEIANTWVYSDTRYYYGR